MRHTGPWTTGGLGERDGNHGNTEHFFFYFFFLSDSWSYLGSTSVKPDDHIATWSLWNIFQNTNSKLQLDLKTSSKLFTHLCEFSRHGCNFEVPSSSHWIRSSGGSSQQPFFLLRVASQWLPRHFYCREDQTLVSIRCSILHIDSALVSKKG